MLPSGGRGACVEQRGDARTNARAQLMETPIFILFYFIVLIYFAHFVTLWILSP